jgi:hypothetical protein
MLESDDEGELDSLALLVASLGGGGRVLDPQLPVGVGLDPDRFTHGIGRLRLARIDPRSVVDREYAPRPPPNCVQTGIRRNPVKPGTYRASSLERRQSAPCAKQRLLQRVLGVVKRPEHAIAVGVQTSPVRFDQAAEGELILAAGGS